MKVLENIRLIERDGWYLVRQKEATINLSTRLKKVW